MRQRYYMAQEYDLDLFKYQLLPGRHERLTEPTEEDYAKRHEDLRKKRKPTLPPGWRWETVPEFNKRAQRDTKQGAGYYGLADWEPSPWEEQRNLWLWYWWFDVRRMASVIVATAMILVHAMLMA